MGSFRLGRKKELELHIAPYLVALLNHCELDCTILDCGGFEIWQMAIWGVIWEVLGADFGGLIFSYFLGTFRGDILG